MNRLVDFWWQWMMAASVQLAVLVALLALITFFGYRLSARLRYALWTVALVKAMLPPFLSAPWSLARGVEPVFSLAWLKMQAFSLGGNVAATEVVAYLFPVWLCGVAVYWCFILFKYGWAMGLLAKGQILEGGPIFDTVTGLCRRLGIKKRPCLVLSDSVTSPFLWGVGAPNIALPADMPDVLSPNELRCVLLHELVHYRRGDLMVGCVGLFVKSIFWFHPLVWLGAWCLRRQSEFACDEAVLESRQTRHQEYGGTLLKVYEYIQETSSIPVRLLGFSGILEHRSELQCRMLQIVAQPEPPRKIGVVGWGVLLLFALCVLPMA